MFKFFVLSFFFGLTGYASSNYCIAVDRGYEEHRGGHRAVASSKSSACSSAKKNCLKYHGKCRIYERKNYKEVAEYICKISGSSTEIYLKNKGRLRLRVSGYGNIQYYSSSGSRISRKSVRVSGYANPRQERKIYSTGKPDDAARCKFEPYGVKGSFR